jgi:DNA repair protein RadC
MQTLSKEKSYAFTDSDMVMGEDLTYVLRVRDLPIEEKPREKMMLLGVQSLSHVELMAVLLGVGTRKEEVLAMAGRIVHEYGKRAIVNEKNPHRLAESLGIPLAKACQIVASYELGRRSYQHKAGKPVCVRTAKQAYDHLRTIGMMQKEQLRGLYLNSRYHVIHEETISVGSLTANIVHPREVFQPAIEHGAVAVILAHNHPSGVLEPTNDDKSTTLQLVAAGKVLGIELLDHLVITSTSYVSIIGAKE